MRTLLLMALLTVSLGFVQQGSSCAPAPPPPLPPPPGDGDTGGGDTGGGDTGGGDTGGGAVTLTAVKTSIEVHNSARVSAGDDLVVFGTGAVTGVGYIIPSQGDTTARSP